jgi:hypothetical protein
MNIEHEVNELLRRVAELESKKPTPGPRGPAGDVVAAERAIGRRISESVDTLKAASDQAVARTKTLEEELEVAISKVRAVGEQVELRLKNLNDQLSCPHFLDTKIIQVLIDYQLLADGEWAHF